MRKRIVAVFFLISLVLCFLVIRIMGLMNSENLMEIATEQNRETFTIQDQRGYIYDRNMEPLVNTQEGYKAIVEDSCEDNNKLLQFVDDQEKEGFWEKVKKQEPFMVELRHRSFKIEGVDTYLYKKRYANNQLAPHLIGYIDKEEQKGISGIEKVFDNFLSDNIQPYTVSYTRTASGELLKGSKEISDFEDTRGVVTTLNKSLQEKVQTLGNKKIQKGAIVVADAKSGEVLASASFPNFDPNNLQVSLDNKNSPFIDRTLNNYAVGSTFKLLIAAAALESGVSPEHTYTCTGSIEVNGQVYKCHHLPGHGTLNMDQALTASCNPYFVDLAKKISPELLHNMAQNMQFGESIDLGGGMKTDQSLLPTLGELKDENGDGQLNNFAFGQGTLMASPMHILNLVNAVVNDGELHPPTVIKGTVDTRASNLKEIDKMPVKKIYSKETAQFLKQAMVNVTHEGNGLKARPDTGEGAGGKSATAQTGQYDEDGNEYWHGWFSGYYPEKEPKYVIVVVQEHGGYGGQVAAPLFKEVCKAIKEVEEEQ